LLSQKAQQQHLNYTVTEVTSQPVIVLNVHRQGWTVYINIVCMHKSAASPWVQLNIGCEVSSRAQR